MGDLVGLEPAERAQRQRDLCLERERRVAAREDQPQAIVGDLARVVARLLDAPRGLRVGIPLELLLEELPAADPVDGLVAGGLDDPRAWQVRNAGGPPAVDGDGKGFLRRFLGEVEIAHEPYQGGDDPAPIRAVQLVDGRGDRSL